MYKIGKERIKHIITLMSLSLLLLPTKKASANELKDTKIVTGTMKLLSDLTDVLTLASGGITVLIIIYLMIRYQGAEEEGEASRIKKRGKVVLLVGGLIFGVSGLVNIIIKYYQS